MHYLFSHNTAPFTLRERGLVFLETKMTPEVKVEQVEKIEGETPEQAKDRADKALIKMKENIVKIYKALEKTGYDPKKAETEEIDSIEKLNSQLREALSDNQLTKKEIEDLDTWTNDRFFEVMVQISDTIDKLDKMPSQPLTPEILAGISKDARPEIIQSFVANLDPKAILWLNANAEIMDREGWKKEADLSKVSTASDAKELAKKVNDQISGLSETLRKLLKNPEQKTPEIESEKKYEPPFRIIPEGKYLSEEFSYITDTSVPMYREKNEMLYQLQLYIIMNFADLNFMESKMKSPDEEGKTAHEKILTCIDEIRNTDNMADLHKWHKEAENILQNEWSNVWKEADKKSKEAWENIDKELQKFSETIQESFTDESFAKNFQESIQQSKQYVEAFQEMGKEVSKRFDDPAFIEGFSRVTTVLQEVGKSIQNDVIPQVGKMTEALSQACNTIIERMNSKEMKENMQKVADAMNAAIQKTTEVMTNPEFREKLKQVENIIAEAPSIKTPEQKFEYKFRSVLGEKLYEYFGHIPFIKDLILKTFADKVEIKTSAPEKKEIDPRDQRKQKTLDLKKDEKLPVINEKVGEGHIIGVLVGDQYGEISGAELEKSQSSSYNFIEYKGKMIFAAVTKEGKDVPLELTVDEGILKVRKDTAEKFENIPDYLKRNDLTGYKEIKGF